METNAQDLNDEMKKRLRQSLIAPEKQPEIQPLQHNPQLMPGQNSEILKVSPFTKLPTRADRIQLLTPPENYKVTIDLNVTNAPPINMRPAGSVKYEYVGKHLRAIPNGGEMGKPSGLDFDPIRNRIRRREARTDRLVKAYNNR